MNDWKKQLELVWEEYQKHPVAQYTLLMEKLQSLWELSSDEQTTLDSLYEQAKNDKKLAVCFAEIDLS